MRWYRSIIVFILLVFTMGPSYPQKVLVMYKPGHSKHFFYNYNDPVKISLGKDALTLSGTIKSIGDSSMVVNPGGITVQFRNIVSLNRKRFAPGFLKPAFLAAGSGYLALTCVNNAINGRNPLVDAGTALTSAGLFAAAGVCQLTREKHYLMRKGWRFKVLDYDKLKSMPDGINNTE